MNKGDKAKISEKMLKFSIIKDYNFCALYYSLYTAYHIN